LLRAKHLCPTASQRQHHAPAILQQQGQIRAGKALRQQPIRLPLDGGSKNHDAVIGLAKVQQQRGSLWPRQRRDAQARASLDELKG